MSLPTKHVLGILVDNLMQRKSVLKLSPRTATRWAQSLNIPRGGKIILYTGHMYQLIPAISALAAKMAFFENSWITRFFGLGRFVNKFVNLAWFMARTDSGETKQYNDTLRNIALMLRAAKVDFGYLYEEEMYSGALVHDEGVDDAFRQHAQRVFEVFKRNGVKTVITVDPHTTNMLRSIYPRYVEGYDLEVKSYLEVLVNSNLESRHNLELNVTIHDSCVYARYENIVSEPRLLLRKAGAKIIEPELAGKLTHCCGGPIESFFPGKAQAIAEKRIEQLAAAGGNIVAMCPICLVNLKHAAKNKNIEVKDISEYLVEAYCGEPQPVEGVLM
ncbi:MAG: (Fe-S)-binding protein [Candidatus Zixiibacteriota bacterium]